MDFMVGGGEDFCFEIESRVSSDCRGVGSACTELSFWGWVCGLLVLKSGSLVVGWRGEATNSPGILMLGMVMIWE